MSLADPTTVSMSRIESGMIGKMLRVCLSLAQKFIFAVAEQ
jgi:hypothetical protein